MFLRIFSVTKIPHFIRSTVSSVELPYPEFTEVYDGEKFTEYTYPSSGSWANHIPRRSDLLISDSCLEKHHFVHLWLNRNNLHRFLDHYRRNIKLHWPECRFLRTLYRSTKLACPCLIVDTVSTDILVHCISHSTPSPNWNHSKPRVSGFTSHKYLWGIILIFPLAILLLHYMLLIVHSCSSALLALSWRRVYFVYLWISHAKRVSVPHCSDPACQRFFFFPLRSIWLACFLSM